MRIDHLPRTERERRRYYLTRHVEPVHVAPTVDTLIRSVGVVVVAALLVLFVVGLVR